jgi:hypothetical protein
VYRRRPALGLLAILAIAGGCAPLQTDRLLRTAEAFPQPVELTAVPFFPQSEYQCGPAALATVLNWSGVETSAEALVPQVYLPARQGSLQVEILAGARRHGRIAYVLPPHLEALLSEVASGHPVLVLQNLGLSWSPTWHYAVVVGFDLPKNELVLRSGTEARHRVPLHTFERTWARGEYWAVVVLPPGRLPHTAEEQRYLAAVITLERTRQWDVTATAYEAALKRWPKSLGAWLGLGNSRYGLGDLAAAAQAFRRATELHPSAAPAFNNLAQTLLESGQLDEAAKAADRAIELGGPHLDVYRETREEIRRRALSR